MDTRQTSGLGGEGAVQAGGASIAVSGAVAGALVGGPLGAAIGGAAGLVAMGFDALFAPNTQKIQSSNDVNTLEVYLKQNLANWNAEPHTVANQQAAEGVFNQVWAQTVTTLSDPALGSAGKVGISDRQQGGKWDWFAMYYNPIANATDIQDAGTVSGTITSLVGSNGALMIAAAALVIGVIGMVSSND